MKSEISRILDRIFRPREISGFLVSAFLVSKLSKLYDEEFGFEEKIEAEEKDENCRVFLSWKTGSRDSFVSELCNRHREGL